MANASNAISEREISRLLKRIDRLVPLEESETRLLERSKRVTYSRAAMAIIWIVAFTSMWAVLYYSMLSAQSDSMSYIVPRLSLSVGLMAAILFLRITDRLKMRWALVAAVMIFLISRSIV